MVFVLVSCLFYIWFHSLQFDLERVISRHTSSGLDRSSLPDIMPRNHCCWQFFHIYWWVDFFLSLCHVTHVKGKVSQILSGFTPQVRNVSHYYFAVIGELIYAPRSFIPGAGYAAIRVYRV